MKSFFSKLRNRKENNDSNKSELECITSDLIEEAKREIEASKKKIVTDKRTLEPNEVEEIIKKLIGELASKRNGMIGRIEKDIEGGALFDRYFGKMQTINTLTNSTYALMQKMYAAKEKYEKEKAVYNTVMSEKYIEKMIPSLPKKGRFGKESTQDIFEAINIAKKAGTGTEGDE
ncbi:MAG: hypothetical protein SPK32_05940 [Bacteroidaceae bacterium]|nr:hypothetical protein [Bacteroidaceae bacterium]